MSFESYNDNAHYLKYKAVRALHQEVSDNLLDYLTSQDRFFTFPEGMQHAEELAEDGFTGRIGERLSLELAVYPFFDGFESVVEMYLRRKRFRRPDKIAMLESMRDSQFIPYVLLERNDKNAIVKVRNLVNDEVVEITDTYLGTPILNPNVVYLARLQTYDGITFNTGLTFPFKRNGTLKRWMKDRKDMLAQGDTGQLIIDAYLFYKKYGLNVQSYAYSDRKNKFVKNKKTNLEY